MKNTAAAYLSIILILAVAPVSWSYSSNAPDPLDPNTIFGVVPWESRDSIFAKCISLGIQKVEIKDDYSIFKDLISRDTSAPSPTEVKYYFLNDSVSRITVTYTGSSIAHKIYFIFLFSRFGQPDSHESRGISETIWKEEKFFLILRSNQNEQMEQQLATGKREPEKIHVTMDIIYYANPSK